MQRKKVVAILFTAAVAALCLLPLLVMPWQNEAAVGNEKLAAVPKVRTAAGAWNTDFLGDLSDYVTDHFGFRHAMITLQNRLTGTALHTLNSDSVLLGKDGWLFYRETEEDYTGANLFTARQSYAAAHTLKLMQEYCAQNDIRFCFTIAPNKNSLYGSQMPTRYKAASVRNAQLLAAQMQQQGVNYFDLFGLLGNSGETLYYKYDSHWTMEGAQLAAQGLLQTLDGRTVDFDALKTGQTQPHTGDLYEMVYSSGTETEPDAAYAFSYEYDAKFHSAEDITIHTTNAGETGSVFVYRDSFGINLHPFLAQSYGKACFSRSMPYVMSNVLEEQPDLLLVEIVERNLDWLLERAPKMPSPARTVSGAQATGGEIIVQQEESTVEGCFSLSGDLGAAAIDDNSEIYILGGGQAQQAYEAFPCGDGQTPFTAVLPLELQGQPLTVAFYSDGTLVSYAVRDAAA
jgi:hypothetical protein